MKIGITYSQNDWTASEIALKIQAIAFSHDIDCYISPKHTVRNDEKVLLQLRKCSYIFFISYDEHTTDDVTYHELKHLNDKYIIGIIKKPFKVPDNLHFSKTIEYDTSTDAIKYLQDFIQKISKKKQKSSAKKDENTALLLGLTALLLLLITSAVGKKK
jgi:hypothetical protein